MIRGQNSGSADTFGSRSVFTVSSHTNSPGPVSYTHLRPYNIAVLPAGAGRLYVYLYPAQTDPDVYPLGGDVRYLISPDGMKIVEKRQLHKTIIETPPASSGETVAGGYHVHVLSDLPEDTDVMFVLTRKPLMPEVILARGNLYAIDVHGVITVRPR